MDSTTNHLIELIYDAALEPSKWSDLLNSLAEFVDYVDRQSNGSAANDTMLAVLPGIDASAIKSNGASIAETLKVITDLDADESIRALDVGQVNDFLIGHFARAIKIAKRLVDIDEQHEVVLSLLDRLPIALLLVTADATVVESNALADEVINSDSGLLLKNQRLSFSSGQKKLHAAIENMAKHDPATSRGQSLSLTNEATENNLMLFLAPLKHHGMKDNQPAVAVFIATRKSQPLNLPRELSELYGLTEKELQITGQLVRGLSIKEISEESDVSPHTVRSHVKAVLRKTDTTRQAELVSLVYNGMGSFVNSLPAVRSGQRDGMLAKNKPWQQDHRTITLNDGRHLGYNEYGDAKGMPVVHCHCVLGSRYEIPFNGDALCKQKKVRLIVPDRPGFGVSDPTAKYSFKRWADDLTQLLDQLAIEQVVMTGYAMGAQYALACAQAIPDRVTRVVAISAGMPAESSKDYNQMLPLYKMNIRLARYVPKVYRLMSSVLVKGVLDDPEGFFTQLSEKVGEADRAIMTSDQFKTEMFESMREGFRQSGKATAEEIINLSGDWGFDLSKISQPVDIWHGDSDRHVPLVLAERFKKYLKNTRYHVLEGEGHYLFYTHWNKVLDQLKER